MREAIAEWMTTYPAVADRTQQTFGQNAPGYVAVTTTMPNAVRAHLQDPGRYVVKGSAGSGQWADIPWVAALDQSVTTSTQAGFYVVYLRSADGERLYLTVNQGCTVLKNEIGIRGAREQLQQRASTMRRRAKGKTKRLKATPIDLKASTWLGQLYQVGSVCAQTYQRDYLPDDDALFLDLQEAVDIYRHLIKAGGWDADDTLSLEAENDGIGGSLDYQKRYVRHRAAERLRSHADAVKRLQGDRCRGCDTRMAEVYGDAADGLVEAHHLIPLARLTDGEQVTFDPAKDFAVLCPNCHRMIHRMEASDLAGLRALVRKK